MAILLNRRMKRYSSRFLKIVALLFMSFPIVYLVFVGVLFDVPLKSIGDILFSPFYYFTCIFSFLAGYGLWEMRRWAWYLYVFSNFLIVYYSASVTIRLGETHHPILAYTFLIVVCLGTVFRIRSEVRVPYFFPKIRWWETQVHYPIAVPVTLLRDDHTQCVGEIVDLSVKGCFIKCPEDLQQDEKVNVRFDVFGQVTECRGTVVWRTPSTVTRPKGVGIKFSRLNGPRVRRITIASKRLEKIRELCRRPKSEGDAEQFLKNLAMTQKSVGQDKGLLQ